MSFLGIHILTDAQVATLRAAGHDIAPLAGGVVDQLKAEVQTKFPAVVKAFGSAFDELEHDTTVSGFARMEKAVGMVFPQIPSIASELSGITSTSFWLSLGQDLFAKAVPELETVAKSVLAKLA